MSTTTKNAGKAASLVVSLGVLVAIVVSSTTFAASNPERAYGEVITVSEETTVATTTTPVPSALPTTSVSATASVSATTAAPAPKPVVIVPSVMGKTKSIAIRRLKARKLRVKVHATYTTKKSGTVVGQTPIKRRRAVGTTVHLKVAKRWPSGFKSKAASDRFWRPYVVANYKAVDRNRRFKGHHRAYTSANVSMTLRAIWGESRGGARAGINDHDSYLGLLQMNKGYGSTAQRLDPIFSIKRMGRGIKSKGAGWARSRWSTI